MKPITIADLAKNSFGDAEELVHICQNNFGVGASLAVRHRTSIEITSYTKIEEFPEHLHGQIGIIAWAFTKDQ